MQGDQEGQKGRNWGAEEKVVWSHEHSPLGLEPETEEPVRRGGLCKTWGVVLVL